MSINDPIVLQRYSDNRRRPWYLTRGRETFFDPERYMRTWETADQAIAWSQANLGMTPINIEDAPGAEEAPSKPAEADLSDLPLFQRGRSTKEG